MKQLCFENSLVRHLIVTDKSDYCQLGFCFLRWLPPLRLPLLQEGVLAVLRPWVDKLSICHQVIHLGHLLMDNAF